MCVRLRYRLYFCLLALYDSLEGFRPKRISAFPRQHPENTHVTEAPPNLAHSPQKKQLSVEKTYVLHSLLFLHQQTVLHINAYFMLVYVYESKCEILDG